MEDKQNKIPVSIKIDPELLARLDKLAEKGGLTRSKLLTNIIEVSVDTLENCQKVGFLQFSLLLRDLGESMNKWSVGWKNKKVKIS